MILCIFFIGDIVDAINVTDIVVAVVVIMTKIVNTHIIMFIVPLLKRSHVCIKWAQVRVGHSGGGGGGGSMMRQQSVDISNMIERGTTELNIQQTLIRWNIVEWRGNEAF